MYSVTLTDELSRMVPRKSPLFDVSPYRCKAKYFVSQAVTDDAEKWLAKAKPTADTWWHHWKDWLQARSGESRPAPSALGNKRHQPIEQAPGSYAREA